jgi:hypothetical protein
MEVTRERISRIDKELSLHKTLLTCTDQFGRFGSSYGPRYENIVKLLGSGYPIHIISLTTSGVISGLIVAFILIDNCGNMYMTPSNFSDIVFDEVFKSEKQFPNCFIDIIKMIGSVITEGDENERNFGMRDFHEVETVIALKSMLSNMRKIISTDDLPPPYYSIYGKYSSM